MNEEDYEVEESEDVKVSPQKSECSLSVGVLRAEVSRAERRNDRKRKKSADRNSGSRKARKGRSPERTLRQS